MTAAQAFASAGANFSFTAPAAGTYSLFAGYGGDTNYSNAISANSALTITGPQTATTLAIAAPATATAGTAFNTVVSLNVSGTVTTQPTGNIVLTAAQATGATTTLGTITAAQGMAAGGSTVSAALPTAGAYTLTATYAGDSLYAPSSKTAAVTVNGTRGSTTLGVSGPSTVLTGTNFVTTITLKATGSPPAAITGNVTLVANGINGSVNSYSLGTVSAATALASGSVQIPGSIALAGTYSLDAVYEGDPNYTSSSGSVVITVSQLTTSLGLSGATSQVPGVAFPLTVRLAGQKWCNRTPTGNVVISTYVGTTFTTLATVTAAQALASGGYQAQITLPSSGSFTVTAIYAGDASFSASTASLLINAASAATLTLRSTVASPVINAPFTLCVDLASKTTTATPTGNFTLGAVDPALSSVTYPPVSAASSLAKTACTPAFSVTRTGTWVFSATYAGDSNYPVACSESHLNRPAAANEPHAGWRRNGYRSVALPGCYNAVFTEYKPGWQRRTFRDPERSTTAAVTLRIDAKTDLAGATSSSPSPRPEPTRYPQPIRAIKHYAQHLARLECCRCTASRDQLHADP